MEEGHRAKMEHESLLLLKTTGEKITKNTLDVVYSSLLQYETSHFSLWRKTVIVFSYDWSKTSTTSIEMTLFALNLLN